VLLSLSLYDETSGPKYIREISYLETMDGEDKCNKGIYKHYIGDIQ